MRSILRAEFLLFLVVAALILVGSLRLRVYYRVTVVETDRRARGGGTAGADSNGGVLGSQRGPGDSPDSAADRSTHCRASRPWGSGLDAAIAPQRARAVDGVSLVLTEGYLAIGFWFRRLKWLTAVVGVAFHAVLT